MADIDDDPEVVTDEKKALTNRLKTLGGMGTTKSRKWV